MGGAYRSAAERAAVRLVAVAAVATFRTYPKTQHIQTRCMTASCLSRYRLGDERRMGTSARSEVTRVGQEWPTYDESNELVSEG